MSALQDLDRRLRRSLRPRNVLSIMLCCVVAMTLVTLISVLAGWPSPFAANSGDDPSPTTTTTIVEDDGYGYPSLGFPVSTDSNPS